jgi:hypothetical protein
VYEFAELESETNRRRVQRRNPSHDSPSHAHLTQSSAISAIGQRLCVRMTLSVALFVASPPASPTPSGESRPSGVAVYVGSVPGVL